VEFLIILISFFFSMVCRANLEFQSIKASDGVEIQTCARFPEAAKFPGKRPALFFIQGSGLYDTCLRLERTWGDGIVGRGVEIFGRQKRGITVNPLTRVVNIDKTLFGQNDLISLKLDSIAAFEALQNDSRINSNRITVAGGSEGAWMATAIALKHPEVFEVSLISSPIERFDTLFERQLSELAPTEVIDSLDKDHSGALTPEELPNSLLAGNGLLPFSEIDSNHDSRIDKSELGMEFHRAVDHALVTNDDTFLMSDFGGGISVAWLKTAFQIEPLGPEILKLNMPVTLHHGKADTNALVEAVYKLELEAKTLQKTKIDFVYYDGLTHELNKDVLYKILFDLADRLNGPN